MAKFYEKLKALKISSENKPVEGLTEQKWNEFLFIIRGKDEGIPAWHYILVPLNKIDHLKSLKLGEIVDYTQFGSVIEYRDINGKRFSSSGWGINPPRSFQTWIEDYYGDRAFDENTSFEYSKDDIRLCTMQREKPSELLGIERYYNKQGRFHYLKLFDDYDSSLGYRSGIRNYDRIICLNNINIEEDTLDQLTNRFKSQLNLPIQMLVCNPSTYQYYKSNNIIIDYHLPTVQHLKPVFHISLTNQNPSINCFINEYFFVIQWENSDRFCIVSQSSIFKSSDFIEINDICFIEYEEKYRRGIIKFKGSKDQCENIKMNLITQLNHFPHYQLNDNKLILKQNPTIISNTIVLNKKIEFEDLPNELLFDIFDYLTIDDFHHCFSDLNNRFNQLLLSCFNVSLIYNENINPLIIKFYGFKINHLIIDTSNQCHFNFFPNLHSLIIRNRNCNNLKQIRSSLLSNLVYLSFILKSDFKPSIELVNQIFSNEFPLIRYVNLGWIDKPSLNNWSISPSLQFVSIRCDQLMIIKDILQSSPNLKHLQIHVLNKSNISMISSSLFYHSLERFTLWSEQFELTFNSIDILLSFIPNLRHLYFQTNISIPFIHFIENLIKRLNHLIRFDCFIKELLIENERIGNLNNIHQISLCFKRIECIKENEDFRIFATE